MEFLLKALNFYFIYDTSCKNYRNRISHYRTYRCWSRYRCRFRSSYIRCGKKPIFKRTTFFLCNFRFCFFRSYGFVRFDDGFFATLCGITMRAFNVFSVFLSVFVYMLSRNKVFPEKLMALITKKKIFFIYSFFFNKTRSSHKDASIESHKLLLPQPAIEKKCLPIMAQES